jgi:hypothetical protein
MIDVENKYVIEASLKSRTWTRLEDEGKPVEFVTARINLS